VAAECDLIDELAAAAKGAPLTVLGSQGQPVINPLISGLRLHRATLASLLKQLPLPDDDSGAKVGLGVRSVKAGRPLRRAGVSGTHSCAARRPDLLPRLNPVS
jgi:hypothetical protein